MASPLPATPRANSFAAQTVASNDAPGSWSHPQLNEINKRIRASTFDERNVRSLIINFCFLLATFVAAGILGKSDLTRNFVHSLPAWTSWLALALRALPVYNMVWAAQPLWKKADTLADIPLTPKQRSLLGLPQTASAPTPGSTYITPPRYSRSGTPRSDASSRSGSPYSGSRPASGSRGASPLGTTGYSPSPLFQRAVNRDANRRLSFGAGQSPRASINGTEMNFGASSLSLNTPSPTNRSGVALSSKWLYERGRNNSGMRSVYG